MHILNSINNLDVLDFLYIDIRHLMFPSFIYYYFFFLYPRNNHLQVSLVYFPYLFKYFINIKIERKDKNICYNDIN